VTGANPNTRGKEIAMTKQPRLIDGEQMNAVYPDTFWIPSEADRRSIKLGYLVKLMFAVPDSENDDDGVGAERMWVSVTTIAGDTFTGALANSPFFLNDIKFGDEVMFEPKHIIAIQNPEFDSAPDEDDETGLAIDDDPCTCPMCELDDLIARTEQLVVRMKKTRATIGESFAAEWNTYELASPTDACELANIAMQQAESEA